MSSKPSTRQPDPASPHRYSKADRDAIYRAIAERQELQQLVAENRWPTQYQDEP